jgi:predicted nucleic acid-binding protein
MTCIVDSGFLYALINSREDRHRDVSEFELFRPQHCATFEILP